MIVGFAVIIWIGHWGLIAFLLALQIAGYRELAKIRAQVLFPNGVPYSTPWLDVCLFFTQQYYCYGAILFSQFSEFFLYSDSHLLRSIAQHHSAICFSFLMATLVAFVGTLRGNAYLQQFQYLTWTVMTLVTVMPSNFHVSNILQGLFWFVLPVSLIICNDITAYIWGFFFGVHPLIKLSPKKTWEGFIGAFFSTVIFAFIIGGLLSHWDVFICPKTTIFGAAECVKPPMFSRSHYLLPQAISERLLSIGLDWTVVTIRPAQIYAVIFAVFASTVAPFGGFLGSGFKRAFGFKDFGDLIPGHGGIVDRMDCQVMMAAFSFVFYWNFVATANTSSIMMSITSLPLHQQLDLLNRLQTTLQPVTGMQ